MPSASPADDGAEHGAIAALGDRLEAIEQRIVSVEEALAVPGLEAIEQRLGSIEETLDPPGDEAALTERVDQALNTSSDLVDTFAALLDRMETLEKRVTERERKRREHQRVYRFELHETTSDEAHAKTILAAQKNLERLGTWVAWLVDTYRLHGVIPPCWALHRIVFEELAGLRVAWAGAWTDSEARHDAVVVWHEQLWRFRERMTSTTWGSAACAGKDHDDNHLYEEWAANPVGHTAFEAALDAAVNRIPPATREGE